jgi:hypothetical protein
MSPSAGTSQLLVPDATGWVDRSATATTGIQGPWHAYDDTLVSVNGLPAGVCPTADHADGECSIVSEPAPNSPYAPTEGRGMCTSGVIAKWIAGSDAVTSDGSPGWAGITLDLNMPDWPEPPMTTPVAQPYDAEKHGVIGFSFDMSPGLVADAKMRVVLTTVDREQSPAYWGGTTARWSPVRAGRNEFKLTDVGGPPSAPGSFDRAQLLRIAFLVSGSDSQPVGYSFCIEHLAALQAPTDAPPGSNVSSSRRASSGQKLAPDPSGWVDRITTGKTRIQGAWFAAADSIPNGSLPASCQGGYPQCSIVSEPDPRAGTFPPTKDLGMCTSGVVAKTVGYGPSEGSNVWGAMIGFNFNNADFPGTGADSYDADQYGVTGIAFDIDSEPPLGAEIRVELTTVGTETSSAWWGGKTALWSPVHAGHNEFSWKDVGGPPYFPNPPPFNPKKLIQIGFHVPSNPTHVISYGFCIDNLTALLD